jgi:hypothetical protein
MADLASLSERLSVRVPKGWTILFVPLPAEKVALPAQSLVKEVSWACEIFWTSLTTNQLMPSVQGGVVKEPS